MMEEAITKKKGFELRLTFLPLALVLIGLVSLPVKGLIIDNAGIIDAETIATMDIQIDDFNEGREDPLNIVFVTLSKSNDPESNAATYYDQYNADLVILYSVEDNRIASATTDIVLNDNIMKSLMDSWAEDKRGMPASQASSFLAGVLYDIIRQLELGQTAGADTVGDLEQPIINAGEQPKEVCSFLKDGVCNPDCDTDLDCDCGDGECQAYENYDTCSQDCNRTQTLFCGMIRDNNCDLNCPIIDPDCGISKKINISASLAENKDVLMYYLMPALFLILFVLVIGLAYVTAEVIKDRARRYYRR